MNKLMQEKTPLKCWKMISFSIVLFTVFLFFIEFIIRIAGLHQLITYRCDPQFGYSPNPLQKQRLLFNHVTINDIGFRSLHNSQTIRKGRIIYVGGDSVTYGDAYVDDKQTFCYLLEKSMSTKSKAPIFVLNAGINNYSVSHIIARCRTQGIPLRPEVMILYIPDTDYMRCTRPMCNVGGIAFPSTNSHLGIITLYRLIANQLLLRYPKYMPKGKTPFPCPSNRSYFEANLLLLSEFLKEYSKQVKIIVVYHPEIVRGSPQEKIPELLSYHFEKIRGVTLENGGLFLDLTPILFDGHTGDYYRDALHLRVKGHEKVANFLITQISKLMNF